MNELKAYLTDDQGKSLLIKNNTVATQQIPASTDTPKGWDNSLVQFTRNSEFLGLIKAYTTPLTFYFNAAKILRNIFYKIGTEAVVFFIWAKLNLQFFSGGKYEGWYKGQVDFYTFRDLLDESGVEVVINEGGFYKFLQNNKTVPYEIPFDRDAVSLFFDGFPIQNTQAWGMGGDFDYDNPFDTLGAGHEDYLVYTPVMAKGIFEGTNFAMQVNDVNYGDFTGVLFPFVLSGAGYPIKNTGTVPITIHISANVKAAYSRLPSNNLGLIANLAKSFTTGGYINHTPFVDTDISYIKQCIIELDITLAPGEKFVWTIKQGSGKLQYTTDSTFVITFANAYPATVILAHEAIQLGKKLCADMSGGVSDMDSSLLTADKNTLIACGDSLRGLAGAVIKTTFSDYHKSIDAIKCISFQVENNNGKLESRNYAFNISSKTASLGTIVNASIENEAAYEYDMVQVGYPPKDIANNNGRYSFCNTNTYKTPNVGSANVYDAVSKYYSDPVLMEVLRINLDGKVTTDNSSDNDNFFIDAEKYLTDFVGVITFLGTTISIPVVGLGLYKGIRFRTHLGQNVGTTFTVGLVKEVSGNTVITPLEGIVDETVTTTLEWRHYRLFRETYTSISGIPSITQMFNIRLSPATILQNHYSWIRSGCYMNTKGVLTFQTTDKNASLTRTKGGVTITENANIKVVDLGDPNHWPVSINFQAESTGNLLALLRSNPGGYIDCISESGILLKGYPLDMKVDDITLKTQQYKLLATADTDLTQLINGR